MKTKKNNGTIGDVILGALLILLGIGCIVAISIGQLFQFIGAIAVVALFMVPFYLQANGENSDYP